jgi:hypothetical protein
MSLLWEKEMLNQGGGVQAVLGTGLLDRDFRKGVD